MQAAGRSTGGGSVRVGVAAARPGGWAGPRNKLVMVLDFSFLGGMILWAEWPNLSSAAAATAPTGCLLLPPDCPFVPAETPFAPWERLAVPWESLFVPPAATRQPLSRLPPAPPATASPPLPRSPRNAWMFACAS